MKAANIEANVFYRRYGSMENLYDRLAKQYDFWIMTAAYGLLFLGTLFRGM